jgi:hypothetical protein
MVIIPHSHNPHFTINGYCYFDDSHGDDDKSIWRLDMMNLIDKGEIWLAHDLDNDNEL